MVLVLDICLLLMSYDIDKTILVIVVCNHIKKSWGTFLLINLIFNYIFYQSDLYRVNLAYIFLSQDGIIVCSPLLILHIIPSVFLSPRCKIYPFVLTQEFFKNLTFFLEGRVPATRTGCYIRVLTKIFLNLNQVFY